MAADSFESAKQLENMSFAPIGMAISAIETLVLNAKTTGVFHFPYPPELQQRLMKALNWGPSNIQIELGYTQVTSLIDAVRNIILEWTIDMEKQGILGNDLSFTPEERVKSAAVTAQTVNHNIYNIEKVGAFVQHAEQSLVQGGVESTVALTEGARDLVKQVEQLLPAAKLPSEVQQDVRATLDELNEATEGSNPDVGRVQRGLNALRRVLAPAGEHLVRIAVDAAVTKLLGPAA